MKRAAPLLALALACRAWAAEAGEGVLAAAPPLRIYGMDSKPVSYQENGQPGGLTVELAQHIQRRLGRADPIEIIPWARANTLAVHEPNIMLLSIVRTPEREQWLMLVGPVMVVYISAFAVKERAAELRAMGDGIYKLRGGARRGSIFVERARSAGYKVTDEPVSSEVAARMLLQHRFDLWFDDDEVVGPALERAGRARGDVELVRRLSEDQAYFAFSKGMPPATIDAWDAALRDMKRDGSFQKIYRKWLPRYPLPADARPPAKQVP